jgi:CheY-like chemotaxis protein
VVEVSAKRAGPSVRVEVRDHGEGIPEEFRGRIFQKFSQADSSDTRLRGGTGLGLSISKAIIEHLGGAIGFDTRTGWGTNFWFELPEWAPAPQAAEARPCILVCEDDPDIARLIGMMLDQAGYDTEIAGTAALASQLAAENSYAAMTLDIKLPDADGMALVERLRRDTRTLELPIVVVSAIAEKDHIKIGHEAFTISDWLDKPIDQNRLVLAIRHAIAQDSGVTYLTSGAARAEARWISSADSRPVP